MDCTLSVTLGMISKGENGMAKIEYEPYRSLIYVDCAKEEYRHKLQYWLYSQHIPDSIAKFDPWCTKYAFYNALPVPPEGERFGTVRMQMTEHYWMCNPCSPESEINTLYEVFPPEALVWQGLVPDQFSGERAVSVEGATEEVKENSFEAPSLAWAFLPIFWENDLKGKGRTIKDGPNYRWQFMIAYPENVEKEEGDRWMMEEILPKFAKMPEVNRILTSKIIKEVNHGHYDRLVEMWFDGPEEWYKCAVEGMKNVEKPAWGECERFPFLKPSINIASIFISDLVTSDNLRSYRGYIPMR